MDDISLGDNDEITDEFLVNSTDLKRLSALGNGDFASEAPVGSSDA